MRPTTLLLACLILSAAVTGCGRSEHKHATIAYTRTPSWFGKLCDMNVYVNGRKVATVGNGDRTSITFIPAESGRNTMYVELVALIGPDAKSDVVEFQATPGAELTATSKVDGWVAKTQADIHLTVVTDRDGVPPVEVTDVSLNPGVVRRTVTSENFDGPPGTRLTVERSRTIEHTVSVVNSASLEAGLSATLGPLTAGIKARVTTLTGQTVRTAETKKMVIEIDCTRTPRGEVVWVDHIRTGTAQVRLNGVPKSIDFEYQETTELTVRPR